MSIPTKKDRDEITVARSIFDEIVEFTEETPKQKRARKAGRARMTKISDERRSEIANIALAAVLAGEAFFLFVFIYAISSNFIDGMGLPQPSVNAVKITGCLTFAINAL